MNDRSALSGPNAFPAALSRLRTAGEASHLTGFAGNPLDRQSEHRSDTCVADALADPAARLYLFDGERALIKTNGSSLDPLFLPAEAEGCGFRRDDAILLGHLPDGPRLAAPVAGDEAHPDRIKAIDLRSLAVQGVFGADHLGPIAQARSTLAWHENHRFCGRCGGPTLVQGGGVRRYCEPCQRQHFPRVDPVVIMLAIHGEDCLLGRGAHFLPGMYSALAGFVEPGETIEDAVRRETLEESGVAIGAVAYHASQPWPFVSSLMIGCHAEALDRSIRRDEAELQDCRWFSRGEAAAMLAGTHPQGLRTPPRMAIANRLITAFVEAG